MSVVQRLTFCILVAAIVTAFPTASSRADSSAPPVTIRFNQRDCTITLDTGAVAVTRSFRIADAHVGNGAITVTDAPLFSADTLIIAGRRAVLQTYAISNAAAVDGQYEIQLTAPAESPSRRGRAPANRFAAFTPVSVDSGEFVRGGVLVIGSSIRSAGEINGYIVAVFGDIELTASSASHRDVFAIGGSIRRDRAARLHGAFQSTASWKRSDVFRRRKLSYGYRPVEVQKSAVYNRADGLTIGGSISFYSEENFVPRLYAQGGLGLSSNRGKYRLGFDHRIGDYNQLRFGSSVFRQTLTSDDWICGAAENTAFTLLFKQDWRDYYEAEGADFFVEQNLRLRHTLRLEYTVAKIDSLPAMLRLWSLFGPRDHRSNFSSLSERRRADLQQLYGKNEAVLSFSYIYSTVDDLSTLAPAGWYALALYEYSSHELSSDLPFDRWRIELRRYQRLGRLFSLNLRFAYGEATGALPPHRLFYLGGIRTIRGLEHKQYADRRFGLGNIELIVNPRRTIIDLAGYLDFGAVDGNLPSSQNRFPNSASAAGLAVIVGETIRLELSRLIGGDEKKQWLVTTAIGRSF